MNDKIIELLKSIYIEIQNFDSIICLRHISPDGDAFGSQIGLKKLINLNFSNKQVYACGSEVEFFSDLGKMDKIDDSIFEKSLIIVTDTGPTSRIDDERYKLAKKIIKIDHHKSDEVYGDINWIDDSYTSASEMVGFFAQQLNLKVDEDCARTIMYGIVTDSNRFIGTNTNSRTFSVCSYLTKTNWNIKGLYNMVYKNKLSYLKAQSEVVSKMKVINNVVALFLTEDIMEKYNIPYDQNNIFAELLQGYSDVDIWCSFSTNANKTIRAEFRSKDIDISKIAVKYGGGGHKTISGATLDNWEIIDNIIKDLSLLK